MFRLRTSFRPVPSVLFTTFLCAGLVNCSDAGPGSDSGSGGTDLGANGGASATGGGPGSGGGPGPASGGADGNSSGGAPGTGGDGAAAGGSEDGSGGSDVGTGGEGVGGAGTGGAGTGGAGTGGAGGLPPVVDCPERFTNPLIWEDLPDLEVIRVDDVYYYTASTFHHSPGAPLLRSYDLVNWEYISHSVPLLDFDRTYDLNGGNSYVNGIWASTLQYRKSNQTFYWMGCMHDVGGGYVFTAKSPTGPWEKHRSQQCYYDMGLLIDDTDDKMYVAWGNGNISVAELSADGFSQVRAQQVFQTPGSVSGPLEGSRFMKIGNYYYIFLTQYANGEYVIRSTNPFGPYELRPFAVRLPYSGAAGSGGSPHQGGVVQTQKGDWYYVAFNDAYPAGRLPVMAPITWTDGWPQVTLDNGRWGGSYPFPDVTCRAVPPRPNSDDFSTPTLRHEWEWNHNPDNSKWSTGNGLTLQTATVTNDIYAARNTLTRRIEGPVSIATIELDYSMMQNGDVAGLAALRDSTAYIGIKKANGATRVVTASGMTLDANWNTNGLGSEGASANVSGGKIWLRVEANVRTDNGGGNAKFYYSTNGTQFMQLGGTFTMKREWQYFLGYRFGIFNFATQSLGGAVKIGSFEIDKP